MSFLKAISRLFSRERTHCPSLSPPPVRGRYDVAQTTDTMGIHWSNANSLDADACNSLSVRKTIRERARYELANNAHARGIVSTHGNYVIGIGPKLRMQSGSIGFNQMVEADWKRWCKTVAFSHKIRLAFMAKTGDGEGILQIVTNPAVRNPVQLDIAPIECDRLTAPVMVSTSERYVDGITFDEYGNPVSYDILDRHPGAAWASVRMGMAYERVPASFIVHWFRSDRPGQHRGVSELTPCLNLFGQARRFKEAVIACAEFAASVTAMVAMGEPNDGPDEAVPFTTIPMEKGVVMATPAGADPHQMKSEQPTTTYDMFMRTIISEEARPLNMPYNIAACDNKDQNFSGGRLNHHTYFVSVDVERSIAETQAVDVVFEAWFREQSTRYRAAGLGNELPVPQHSWDWPAMPQIDDLKTANARKTALGSGTTRLGLLWAEDGLDFDDELPLMAAEYGLSVDEMRVRLLECAMPTKAVASPEQPASDEQDVPARSAKASEFDRFSLRN